MQPGLARKVQRGRRRTRLAVAGIMLGAAAAAGAVYVEVTASPPPAAQIQAASATALNFTPVADSAMVATGSLTTQPWGTQIDWQCTYTPSPADYALPGGLRAPEEYGLVVVDSRGATTQVATWTATPGDSGDPTATTVVPRADIRSIEIRAVASGKTLLAAHP